MKLKKKLGLAFTISWIGIGLMGFPAYGKEINMTCDHTGKSDVSKEIKAAIEAAEAGDQINFTSGTYLCESSIVISKGVVLNCNGSNFIRTTASAIIFYPLKADGTLTIKNASFDGCGLGSEVLDFREADIVLENVNVSNSSGKGIVVSKGNFTMTGGQVSNCQEIGIHATTASLDLSQVSIVSNGDRGLLLGTSSKATITSSSIKNNGSNGKSTGHGIGIGASSAKISNTTVTGNNQCGISLSGGASLSLTGGNKISSNGHHGVGTDNKDSIKVSGKNNSFDINKASGIGIARGSSAKITGASFSKNKVAGLSVNDSTATVKSCKFSKNSQYGILSNKSTLKVSKSSLNSNKKSGLCAGTKSKLTVTGSTFKKNSWYGIYAKDKGTKVKVTKSNFIQNNKTGICTEKGCKLTQKKNTFKKNKLMDIYQA